MSRRPPSYGKGGNPPRFPSSTNRTMKKRLKTSPEQAALEQQEHHLRSLARKVRSDAEEDEWAERIGTLMGFACGALGWTLGHRAGNPTVAAAAAVLGLFLGNVLGRKFWAFIVAAVIALVIVAFVANAGM